MPDQALGAPPGRISLAIQSGALKNAPLLRQLPNTAASCSAGDTLFHVKGIGMT